MKQCDSQNIHMAIIHHPITFSWPFMLYFLSLQPLPDHHHHPFQPFALLLCSLPLVSSSPPFSLLLLVWLCLTLLASLTPPVLSPTPDLHQSLSHHRSPTGHWPLHHYHHSHPFPWVVFL